MKGVLNFIDRVPFSAKLSEIIDTVKKPVKFMENENVEPSD